MTRLEYLQQKRDTILREAFTEDYTDIRQNVLNTINRIKVQYGIETQAEIEAVFEQELSRCASELETAESPNTVDFSWDVTEGEDGDV